MGTGIKARFQISPEAVAAIKCANKVFYLVSDTFTELWIRKVNRTAQSLADCYAEGKKRLDSYNEMVQIILREVRPGRRVCVALYGHPGVGVYVSRKAIRIARAEGFETRMQPGISAEDCLFADLGIDPLNCGCHSFEATDFLLHRRVFDPRSVLILWQIGVLGNDGYRASGKYELRCLPMLQKVLLEHYNSTHKIVLYSAPAISIGETSIREVRLGELAKSSIHSGYTMYVPPIAQTDPDPAFLKRLGLTYSRLAG